MKQGPGHAAFCGDTSPHEQHRHPDPDSYDVCGGVRPNTLAAQLADEQAAALTPPTDTLRAALERLVETYRSPERVPVYVLRDLLADTAVANTVLHGVLPDTPAVRAGDRLATAQGVALVPVRTSAQLAAELEGDR